MEGLGIVFNKNDTLALSEATQDRGDLKLRAELVQWSSTFIMKYTGYELYYDK